MYMTNEEWEQNNQDYLKESYEETGFTAGRYFTMSTPKTAAGKRAIPGFQTEMPSLPFRFAKEWALASLVASA